MEINNVRWRRNLHHENMRQ